MSGENYVNTASTATTAAPVGPSDTTFTVAGFTGWPAAPFWGEFEKGTASAEIVRVTNVAGSVLTITRGQGGTAATSHGAGVTFEHVVPASHFNETETHMAATTAHGVTGVVVGTTGSQTVQDKTFRGAFKSQNSDALPSGVTKSFESVADNALARDGFVHTNTAGDAARRGFLLTQSGTDRFQVRNDGTVDVNPSTSPNPGLRNRGTTQLDGAATIGGTATVTGHATLNGGLSVTGNLSATGIATLADVDAASLDSTGPITATNATLSGELDVTGISTLGGNVAALANLSVAGTLEVGAIPDVLAAINNLNALVSKVANPPRAQVLQSAPQSLTASTFIPITFDAESYDSHNAHSLTGNNSRYVAPVAGKYLVTGKVSFALNTNGSRAAIVMKNGTVVEGSESTQPASNVIVSVSTVPVYVELAVGEYVEVAGWQNAGGTVATSVADLGKRSMMSVLLVRDNSIA